MNTRLLSLLILSSLLSFSDTTERLVRYESYYKSIESFMVSFEPREQHNVKMLQFNFRLGEAITNYTVSGQNEMITRKVNGQIYTVFSDNSEFKKAICAKDDSQARLHIDDFINYRVFNIQNIKSYFKMTTKDLESGAFILSCQTHKEFIDEIGIEQIDFYFENSGKRVRHKYTLSSKLGNVHLDFDEKLSVKMKSPVMTKMNKFYEENFDANTKLDMEDALLNILYR